MSEKAGTAIAEFLAEKRIAVAGVSRNPNDFTAGLFRDLRKQGYDAVPVNPEAQEIDGIPCYASVEDITPPVGAALIMTKPAVAETIVHDCYKAKIGKVWLYRAGGPGAVSPAAVDFCKLNGITVVPGACPYMFLPGSGWFHRFHGTLLKLVGKYPG